MDSCSSLLALYAGMHKWPVMQSFVSSGWIRFSTNYQVASEMWCFNSLRHSNSTWPNRRGSALVQFMAGLVPHSIKGVLWHSSGSKVLINLICNMCSAHISTSPSGQPLRIKTSNTSLYHIVAAVPNLPVHLLHVSSVWSRPHRIPACCATWSETSRSSGTQKWMATSTVRHIYNLITFIVIKELFFSSHTYSIACPWGQRMEQGCIQVSDFNSISQKGRWGGGLCILKKGHKRFITFCQMWGDLPSPLPKFGGQVANLGGILPSLAPDTTLMECLSLIYIHSLIYILGDDLAFSSAEQCAVKCRYNAVQFIMILHMALQ